MYKDIEKIYKKKSPYNIIMKKTFLIYVLFILTSLIFNFFNKVILMILVFVAMILVLKKVSEKVLNTKLHFNFEKNKANEETLSAIIKNADKNLFKRYSVENNFYNEKSLICIINHYRNLIKPKIVGGNLLAILSIIIPTILSFLTKDGFDFNSLTNTIPYLVTFTIMIIILYFLYNQFISMKNLLKGEDGMIERLEEIFSELYVECVSESSIANKEKVKKTNKKKTKTSKK